MKIWIPLSLAGLLMLTSCNPQPSQQKIENQLQTAIIRGDIQQARKILYKVEDPAALATKSLGIAMIHSGRKKHADMLKLLVENGGDLNSLENGRPVVINGLIFQKMTPELLQWCIERGYNVNLTDKKNRTALAVCLNRIQFETEQQYQMIQMLINAGASVNIESHGLPILHRLVIFNETTPKSKELLELLIKAGADLEAKDNQGKTPLFVAIEYGKEEVAEQLLENGASHDVADKYGTTILFKAAEACFINGVKMLIAQGADVNVINSGNFTPLQFAINSYCNKEVVTLLLEAGADVNHLIDGKTILDIVSGWASCSPDTMGLSPEQERMINLLTAHGAKTAAQLKQEANS